MKKGGKKKSKNKSQVDVNQVLATVGSIAVMISSIAKLLGKRGG